MITQDITLKGLDPHQIELLQRFIQHVLVDNGAVIYERQQDVRRTANELVNTGQLRAAFEGVPFAPPPPPPAPNDRQPGNGEWPRAYAPAAAPSPAPAAVTAPAAPTGPAAAPGAADAPRDSRGVPHHPDHHTAIGSKVMQNPDGSWKKRRGHNPAALAAYEAAYLQPQRQAEAAALANPTFTTAPAAVSAPVPEAARPVTSTHDPNGASFPQASPAPAAPPPPAPPAATTAAEMFGAPLVTFPLPGTQSITHTHLEQLWAHLAMQHRVGSQHEAHMVGAFGGRPGADVYRVNPGALTAAYTFLYQFMPVA